MIRNMSDQLANERTYLSWIRTSISVMAFGFLVERFNLFLYYAAQSLKTPVKLTGHASARMTGIGLIAVGVLALLFSTWRYVRRQYEISRVEERASLSLIPEVTLGLLLSVVALYLLFYLSRMSH